MSNKPSGCTLVGYLTRTNLLRADRRLISETILVNFNFTRQPLAIERRPHEDLGQPVRASTLHLDEGILLNDISHFFLLLLTLVHLLFQVSDLFGNHVEAMTIRRAIRNGTNKRCIRVFKGLSSILGQESLRYMEPTTHCILLLACKLTRSLEIDPKVGKLAFIVLANILDGIDVEWNSIAMYRQNDGLCFPVDVDLSRVDENEQGDP